MIFALVLGVLQIRSQINQANQYAELDRIVTAGSAVRSAVGHLQQERSRNAEFLMRGPVSAQHVQDGFTATDRALDAVRRTLRNAPNTEAVRFAGQETERQITELAPIRQQVLGTHVDVGVATNAYSELISVLLSLHRTLISQMSSSQLVSTATTAHELAKISEEIQLQQALVLTGLTRGNFTTDNLTRLAASESRRSAAVKEFRAAATPQQRMQYDQLYARPEVPARESSVRLAMTEHGSTKSRLSPLLVSAATWKEQSRTSLEALNALQDQLDRQLHETAFRLQDSASNAAGLESVILLSALLVASAIVVVVARQLLRSLDALRRSALDTASHELPRAVADIRAGQTPLVPIRQVPVDTGDEIGDVARAFDAVHTQAVNLATEQAELRRSYRDSFVNVSRRSQSLLERQLRLFEQLERDEEDPDQLATLFQLDHLATRMRRNNENLMVLSGADLTRRFTQPTAPADLIRAAVSEIEHYPRVIVEPMPDTRIVGYAASDLVRLLSELLDNAANFSAPQTQVVVSGHRCGDGSLGIEIVDRGIGMTTDELTAANERLTTDGEIELSTSRRMGLFVVGRLAIRHGIHVELSPGPESVGLRASVTLGPELLLETEGAPPAPQPNGTAHGAPRGDDTLVAEFDWEAAEQDAVSQRPLIHNGFHLLRPPAEERQQSDPFVTEEIDPEPRHHQSTRNGSAPTPASDNPASAWFQAAQPIPHTPPPQAMSMGTFLPQTAARFPSSPPAVAAKPMSNGWSFANDQARRRAEEVAAAEPSDFTSAGLPLRIPRAHLVAGSAAAEAGDRARRPRDPNVARGRLASFQAGLRRGRNRNQHASNNTNPTGGPASMDWNPHPHGTELPDFTQEPVDYTQAGLPRRTPRAQLVPGTPTEPAASPRRDADLMRGRLTSFQRGVREGKHSLRDSERTGSECR
ncbi:hypothetical protein GCM10011581_47340 [Saccharopolyspora subtropica]|uniref:histidine kinase n=1 Tax=Saccharopolyspora thermophila TaxID=89367 RepID=A0A917KBE5_9PSEU|nr:hypothetical protein GCM10011581_47340 [Saccharopolyspora subtropica]